MTVLHSAQRNWSILEQRRRSGFAPLQSAPLKTTGALEHWSKSTPVASRARAVQKDGASGSLALLRLRLRPMGCAGPKHARCT